MILRALLRPSLQAINSGLSKTALSALATRTITPAREFFHPVPALPEQKLPIQIHITPARITQIRKFACGAKSLALSKLVSDEINLEQLYACNVNHAGNINLVLASLQEYGILTQDNFNIVVKNSADLKRVIWLFTDEKTIVDKNAAEVLQSRFQQVIKHFEGEKIGLIMKSVSGIKDLDKKETLDTLCSYHSDTIKIIYTETQKIVFPEKKENLTEEQLTEILKTKRPGITKQQFAEIMTQGLVEEERRKMVAHVANRYGAFAAVAFKQRLANSEHTAESKATCSGPIDDYTNDKHHCSNIF